MLELLFQVLMALAVMGVGVLGGYGALSFAWTDLQAWWGYFASRRWPAARGRIDQATITAIRTHRAIRYVPEVRYTFQLAGQTYVGERLTFMSWSEWMMQEEAERALAPYPPGAAVEVRYDPRRPQNAVLERRAPRGLMASCFVVVLLGGTSVMCLATGLLGLVRGP